MNNNTKVIKVNKVYEELAEVKRENIMGKCALDFDSTFIVRSTQHTVFKTANYNREKLLPTNRAAYITSKAILDKNGKIIIVITNNRYFKELNKLKYKLKFPKI